MDTSDDSSIDDDVARLLLSLAVDDLTRQSINQSINQSIFAVYSVMCRQRLIVAVFTFTAYTQWQRVR